MKDPKATELILKFWFEDTEPKKWFKKDPNFDALIAERFGALVERALAGRIDDWAVETDSCLALILLLDQFTRHMFRGMPKSFAGDEMALALSLKASRFGWIENSKIMAHRKFFLMPMMHVEDLAIQDASLPLFRIFTDENTHRSAVLHRDIIARFGHFPHRNKILGRPSTTEEIAFLKEPNSSF